ncbi:MAG: hypothetical protein ACI9C4_001003 [Paraglaciecola sp.]|jgi:hypothetical protein
MIIHIDGKTLPERKGTVFIGHHGVIYEGLHRVFIGAGLIKSKQGRLLLIYLLIFT